MADVSVTDLIFKVRHEVTVPTMATISEATIDGYGLHSSGLKGVDSQMYNAPLRVYATINEQVHYWEKGHYVRIRNADIANKIYADIQTYLRSWVEMMNGNSMNRGSMPTSDLQSLDNYAGSLHEMLGITGKVKHEAAELVHALNPIADVADWVIETSEKEAFIRDDMTEFFDSGFVDKKRF